jgi:AbrB family looped-hinge helix DNA binding protein
LTIADGIRRYYQNETWYYGATMSTLVTRKGQVTIPKRVRDFLDIKPGTAVDFALDADGRVVLTRAGARQPRKSRFAKVRGRATAGMSTDQIMALTRGED